MSPIDKLPDFDWSELAKREIVMTGEELLAQSDTVYRVGDVAVCGVIYHSFTSPPWFWFALANGVTFRDLIDFRRLATHIPQGSCTAVQVDNHMARRFAEFYGFADTGYERDGYTIFRKS